MPHPIFPESSIPKGFPEKSYCANKENALLFTETFSCQQAFVLGMWKGCK